MKLQASARTVWRMSFPLVLCGLGDTIVGVTDTIFLARFGVIELGAVALAAAIYETGVFVMFGVRDGIQIITARRVGQAKEKAVGEAFRYGLTALLATAVILFLALKFVAPSLMELALRSENVARAVNDFLGIVAFRVFFDALNFAYTGFYSGMGRTRVFIGATAVMAVTNLLVDYLLIFGNLGYPRLGIKGAAIAALLAEIAACTYMTVDVLKQGYARRFGLFQLRLREQTHKRRLLVLSLPLALERLVEHARWFLFFLIIEHIGENALAKANVIYSCYVVFLITIDGFSEAAMTLVSNLIGQNQAERINSVIRSTVLCAAVVLTPFVLLLLLFPEIALSLFTSDTNLLQGSVNGLRVVGLAILIAIPGEMVLSAVAGAGDTWGVLIIELLLSACVLAFAFSATMIFQLPLEVAWMAEVIGWLCCLSLSFAWLKSRARKGVYI